MRIILLISSIRLKLARRKGSITIILPSSCHFLVLKDLVRLLILLATTSLKVACLVLFPVAIDVGDEAGAALDFFIHNTTRRLLLVLLLLDLDLHEGVRVFGVEVCGAEGHLRLLEDGLFWLPDVADLIVFHEKVSVCCLSMPIDLLLQTLIRFSLGQHLIIRVGHAVIAGLP